jgi:translation initiation factor IF-3
MKAAKDPKPSKPPERAPPENIFPTSDKSPPFLTKGDKVKFTVQFRGREMQHTGLGYELMKRITDDTAKLGKIEVKPKFEGRQIIMIIQPL